MGYFDFDKDDPETQKMLEAFGGKKKKEIDRRPPVQKYVEDHGEKILTEDDKTRRFLAHYAKICKTYNRSLTTLASFVVTEFSEKDVDKVLSSSFQEDEEKKRNYF